VLPTGTKLVASVVLVSCCLVMPGAQRPDSARTAIDAYRMAIQAAQKEPSRGRLEVAFNAVGSLRDELLLSREGGRSLLESLSEQEFTALAHELAGLVVSRDEAIFVEPNVVFFGRLAARGDPADLAFFAALSSTYPQSVWPVYIDQQTDYSGCTRYGSGTLVSTYVKWVALRRQYPKRYEEASSMYLDEIVKQLTESTCACSDGASVERELTEFLRRAAASEVRARVEARLAAVRSGRTDIRFACKSG
jgi:predicted DNA-binding protein (UPF0278 family)